ncbi:MAG: hypothetical protein ACYCPS_05910 [Candidatus Saccharimonadales bacterium]
MGVTNKKIENITRSRLIVVGFVLLTGLSSLFIVLLNNRLTYISPVIWSIFWLGVGGTFIALSVWILTNLDPTLDSPDPSYISGILEKNEADLLLRYLRLDNQKRLITFCLSSLLFICLAVGLIVLSVLAGFNVIAIILIVLPFSLLEIIYIWGFIVRPMQLNRKLVNVGRRAIVRLKIKGKIDSHPSPFGIGNFLFSYGPSFKVGPHLFRAQRGDSRLEEVIKQNRSKEAVVEIAAIMPDIPLRITIGNKVIYDQVS